MNECPTCDKPIEKSPKPIWHYTKRNILEKIFPPKDNEEYKENENGIPQIHLRFNHCRSTNDPLESLYLYDLLLENEDNIIKKYKCSKKNFDEIIKNPKDPRDNSYIFSMSYLEDSFAFWNKEYAGTDGIAIEFDKDKFEKSVQKSESEISRVVNDVCYDEPIETVYEDSLTLYKLLYKQDKNFIDSLSKEHSAPSEIWGLKYLLDCYSGSYKLAAWKHEQEIRAVLAYVNPEERERIEKKVKIEFMKNRITKSLYERFDKNIVKSIMLGPDCDDKDVKAVNDYLIKNGYEGITVYRSKAFDLRHNL